jgi:MFS transporter, NNP family, nitrate/nitrite transporter
VGQAWGRKRGLIYPEMTTTPIGCVMVPLSPEPADSGTVPPRPVPRALVLVVATVGLGLNLKAWMLLGPQLFERFEPGMGRYVLLAALPVVVAALVRLPVGVLTDRYGARMMFPAVSIVAAVCVCTVALAGSLPVVVLAGAGAGVGGAAFVVGGALVATVFPYGMRGTALGVFSLGPAFGVVTAVAARGLDPGGRRSALVIGGLLVGFAVVAGVVLRDQRGTAWSGSPLRRCVELIRLASATSLSLLYALALGGLLAIATYLPVYLGAVFHVPRIQALGVTGLIVGLSATARLVGGWWTDRRPTAHSLVVCYGTVAALCLAVAAAPRRWWLTVPLILAVAVCDGAAGGALLTLIGKAARPGSVGSVMGVTGSVAALGALLPVLLAGVDALTHSYAPAWLLLAGVFLAAALYVRGNGLRIGLGLPVRLEPDPSPTAMTVAVVGGPQIRLGVAAVVARLAELATSDELVVVYGSDQPPRPGHRADSLVAGLRDRLPRYSIVAVSAARHGGALARVAALLNDLIDAGSVAVAVTSGADLRGVAAELSRRLHADRILMLSFTPADGARTHEIAGGGLASLGGG